MPKSSLASALPHQEAHKLAGERRALAKQGSFDELLRMDELESAKLLEDNSMTEIAKGAEEQEKDRKKARQPVGMIQRRALNRAMAWTHVTGNCSIRTRGNAE